MKRKGWHSRGYIPHYDAEGLIQHVTVHLADSIPKSAIEKIDMDIRSMPIGQRKTERRRKLHNYMDAGYGVCLMKDDHIAGLVENALLYFNDQRYHLHAWVVMPNHFHVLVEPLENWSLAKIVASWKKYTARKIKDYTKTANQEIGGPLLAGMVWHREYWDRFIRNERHYSRTVEYIHFNPVLAGLVEKPEEWVFSSADVDR